MTDPLTINFSNSFARLGDGFSTPAAPTPVAEPSLLLFNRALADTLGIQVAGSEHELASVFSGNQPLEGAEPLSQVYSGHQFGHFSAVLGDGRAILLGEVIANDGSPYDIQLKGAGPTPFSRNGDGRAALGPVLREYLIAEAMHALGVPTTRALAAVATGQEVHRDTKLPGAVLTRVASSHLRLGTFQYFAAHQDHERLKTLADFAIERHYPHAKESPHPYRAFLEAVAIAQGSLVAHWMLVGFVHGVMNTDNISISGETIDYGPCAFMDQFDPATVFSSIDRRGRYAYGRQPRIGLWNLTRFAEALLPLLGENNHDAVEQAEAALDAYSSSYESTWLIGMARKIGIAAPDPEDDPLPVHLLQIMGEKDLDFTLTFRRLAAVVAASNPSGAARAVLGEGEKASSWIERWLQRLNSIGEPAQGVTQRMLASSPAIIPRNVLVEDVLASAAEGDMAPFLVLHEALKTPFDRRHDNSPFAQAPRRPAEPYKTYCGT